MTTPNTGLQEQLARALFEHEHDDRPTEWREMAWNDMGGSEPCVERIEYELAAAAVLPIVEAAVKAGKAEAWEEGTEAVEYDYEVRGFLRIPDDNPYRQETPDERS